MKKNVESSVLLCEFIYCLKNSASEYMLESIFEAIKRDANLIIAHQQSLLLFAIHDQPSEKFIRLLIQYSFDIPVEYFDENYYQKVLLSAVKQKLNKNNMYDLFHFGMPFIKNCSFEIIELLIQSKAEVFVLEFLLNDDNKNRFLKESENFLKVAN